MNFCPISTSPPVAFSNRVTASGVLDSDDESTVNSISRPLIIHVLDPVLSLSVLPDYANPGERVHFTVRLRNGSTVPIVDIVLRLNLPTYLIPERATVNEAPFPASELVSGMVISGIGPGGTAVIEFDALVTLNSPDSISVEAQANYRYPISPLTGGNAAYSCGLFRRASITSNTVTLTIFTSDLEITLLADRTVVSAENPIVTYTVTVTNRSDSTVNDIIITDITLEKSLEPGMEFVSGSVTVDGTAETDDSPIDGINIGSLTAGASSTITYQVRIAVDDDD
ncbi:MAG: Autotransporter adhesin [Oscillospiraceae bacterium]|nr:Autotransporter adhesin [Oscillospiraceae bacterium]